MPLSPEVQRDPGPRLFALVPCAGVGSRSGASMPKQYVTVAGAPVVAHTLRALTAVARLDAVLLVLSPGDQGFDTGVAPALEPAVASRLWVEFCGGDTRAATVRAGLDALRQRGAGPRDWVLVHDAARCLLPPAAVERLIDDCQDDAVGGLLAVPVADTLKAETGGRAVLTVDRRGKWAAQTPQMFRIGMLSDALDRAGAAVTDESSAIEALGLHPRLVPGPVENLKVTFPSDFDLAERLLASRSALP